MFVMFFEINAQVVKWQTRGTLKVDIKFTNLSAQKEISNVELRKFGEGLTANTEPSLRNQEGVETRHGEPKSEKIWLRYSPDRKQQFSWQ